eukprot:226019-Chlamydomonas_euryale.AAC.4
MQAHLCERDAPSSAEATIPSPTTRTPASVTSTPARIETNPRKEIMSMPTSINPAGWQSSRPACLPPGRLPGRLVCFQGGSQAGWSAPRAAPRPVGLLPGRLPGRFVCSQGSSQAGWSAPRAAPSLLVCLCPAFLPPFDMSC